MLTSSLFSSPAGVSKKSRTYLVRHGETDWNRLGRLTGRSDRPLTERGREQASELGRRLQNLHFESVVSSPSIRAADTARLILEGQGHPIPASRQDDRLLETDFGPFEGWSEDELNADPAGAHWRTTREVPDGMETDEAMTERVQSIWADLSALEGNTLVVAHGGILRALLCACVLGLPVSEVRRLKILNCRLAIIEPGELPLLLGLNL